MYRVLTESLCEEGNQINISGLIIWLSVKTKGYIPAMDAFEGVVVVTLSKLLVELSLVMVGMAVRLTTGFSAFCLETERMKQQ